MSKGSYRDRMWASAMNSESEENNRLRKKVRLLEDKIADMAKFINEQSLELAEAQRNCQDMETKLHNECQAHDRTKAENRSCCTCRHSDQTASGIVCNTHREKHFECVNSKILTHWERGTCRKIAVYVDDGKVM